jgi:hypothetical protein
VHPPQIIGERLGVLHRSYGVGRALRGLREAQYLGEFLVQRGQVGHAGASGRVVRAERRRTRRPMCCTPTWQRIPSASYQLPRGPAVMGALIDPDRMTGARRTATFSH